MQGLRKREDGESPSYGILIEAFYGTDLSWYPRAACRQYPVSKRVDGKTPWVADSDKMYGEGVSGVELIKVALMICHSCPAQYDCARHAVEAKQRGGTYAMAIVDLRWLQDSHTDAEAFAAIEAAEADGVPVQVRFSEARLAERAARRVRARATSAA